MKIRNGYALVRNLVDTVHKNWSKYIEFDKRKVCMVAKEGFKNRQLLARKYNLKYYKYDRSGKRKSFKRVILNNPNSGSVS